MTTLTEADVEDAALEWLATLGWQTVHGPDIAPGRARPGRGPSCRSGTEPRHRGRYPPVRWVRGGAEFGMSRDNDLRQRILSGRSDANIRFEELRSFLLRLGFTERVSGSHHIFRREGVRELINLQRDGSQAEPYQVRQVRQAILRNHL